MCTTNTQMMSTNTHILIKICLFPFPLTLLVIRIGRLVVLAVTVDSGMRKIELYRAEADKQTEATSLH